MSRAGHQITLWANDCHRVGSMRFLGGGQPQPEAQRCTDGRLGRKAEIPKQSVGSLITQRGRRPELVHSQLVLC